MYSAIDRLLELVDRMLAPVDRLVGQVTMTRYDLVLAAIPSVFVVAVLVGNLLSVPAEAAIAGASLVAAMALGDALFVNPPVSRGGTP